MKGPSERAGGQGKDSRPDAPSHEDKLLQFGGYAKSLELFDAVVADMAMLSGKFELTRLISQQIASTDSIAANIEEGYGRGSRKEYIQFLVIARGSTRETMGRYHRLRHWLKPSVVEERIQLCSEITAILSASIKSLRALPSEKK